MLTEKWVSDFALLKKSNLDSKELLIVFSAINTPPKKFLGYQKFNQDSRNVLLINSKPDWYLEGIDGLGDDVYQTANNLSDLIQTELGKIEKIVTFGGSMGGYGALLYGALLDADYSVACGAEAILNIKCGISRDYVSHKKFNLRKVMKSSKSKFRLFYGERCFYDMMCAVYITGTENTVIQTVKNKFHQLPAYFEKKYGLNHIIDRYFAGKEFLLDKNDAGDYLSFPSIIKKCYACRITASQGLPDLVSQKADEIQLDLNGCHDSHVLSTSFFDISCAYYEIKEFKKALDYAFKAYKKVADSSLVLEHLAKCLKITEDPSYIHYCELAIENHLPNIWHDPVRAYEMLFYHHRNSDSTDLKNVVKALNVLSKYPTKPLHSNLVKALTNVLKNEQSNITAEHIEQVHGTNPTFFVLLSKILKDMGKPAESLIAKQKALQLQLKVQESQIQELECQEKKETLANTLNYVKLNLNLLVNSFKNVCHKVLS